jgi:hypothetical protein
LTTSQNFDKLSREAIRPRRLVVFHVKNYVSNFLFCKRGNQEIIFQSCDLRNIIPYCLISSEGIFLRWLCMLWDFLDPQFCLYHDQGKKFFFLMFATCHAVILQQWNSFTSITNYKSYYRRWLIVLCKRCLASVLYRWMNTSHI